MIFNKVISTIFSHKGHKLIFFLSENFSKLKISPEAPLAALRLTQIRVLQNFLPQKQLKNQTPISAEPNMVIITKWSVNKSLHKNGEKKLGRSSLSTWKYQFSYNH